VDRQRDGGFFPADSMVQLLGTYNMDAKSFRFVSW
jgi:hypothetical protein